MFLSKQDADVTLERALDWAAEHELIDAMLLLMDGRKPAVNIEEQVRVFARLISRPFPERCVYNRSL